MRRRIFVCVSALTLTLISCGGLSLVVAPSPTITPVWTPSSLPLPTAYPTVTPIVFPTYTPTLLPTETAIPTATLAATVSFEPQWVLQGPNQVIVPILLYHHIGFSLKDDTVYYVSPEEFDRQMNLLYQWGYKTIPVELLARAIREGAELPPKPIVLTFDDGSESTYTTALPIMQRYHFTGICYIVSNYVGITNYMGADQIRMLYASGWEIGSHSLSHIDLTARPDRQEKEIIESRRHLESLLGVPVLSFAYPFGAYDESSLGYVHLAGYIAAVGLGNESLQETKNLFYLYRQAVRGTDDLRTFALRLPWREDVYELPAVTIVP